MEPQYVCHYSNPFYKYSINFTVTNTNLGVKNMSSKVKMTLIYPFIKGIVRPFDGRVEKGLIRSVLINWSVDHFFLTF